MKKSKLFAIIVPLFLVFTCGFMAGHAIAPEVETTKYIEVPAVSAFDTEYLEEAWCGSGFSEGTIRMIGAWWYAEGVVEDENGQLWKVDQDIDISDFLLLWIADNNTPENPTDDIMIKVWHEAY